VPVAIDVRDLWPEVFVDLAPRWLRGPTELALSPLFAEFRAVCREARAIVGTTDEYIAYACKHADRRAKAWDQSFPLGYRRSQCTTSALEAADAFWNQLGITADSNRFTCCYFGNMGRHCTLDTVIAAAKKLAHDGIPMRFLFCGTGDKLPHYRKLAAGCDSIHFPGWIDAAQIQSLMARCSVGLAPYISNTNFQNNIPNKPIEYLSAGLPIVSSLGGVLQRLIDQHHCGATYDNSNVQQLTSILSQLAQNPDQLHRMSTNARQLYQEKFDADLVYTQMANHLEQLARSRVTTKPHFPLTASPSGVPTSTG
jgi:glycosyltransferase involved in cell wall biosynthesis